MSDWLAWQIVDSAFPTGTFAHSWGLESACQHGEVVDGGALLRYVESSVLQAGYAALPFVNETYQWPARFEALDHLAEVFLANAVANRASRIQGRTLAATAARVWQSPALSAVEARARQSHAHVAPVAGVVFRLLDLPLAMTQKIFLYATARGILAAAVRLGIVGSYEAQRLQHACEPMLEKAWTRCTRLSTRDLAQTAPLIDLLQARHDNLYSRLFQS
jgi:urease accessory protein